MKDATLINLRSWLFALLAIGALFAAGQMLPKLDKMREDIIPHREGDFATLPPGVVLANRAGGIFRALAINTLWMRATEAQDAGEVFELVQLYEWITMLEPRFPMVWAYRAWNAAYNVSVKFPVNMGNILDLKDPRNQPDQRWQWVQRGIEALRDQGIPWNPKAERLYRELAWIYSHKIGQDMDDAHFYYKVMLAYEMQRLLGEPPYRKRLERLSGAPATREALLADEAVRNLVESKLAAAKLDPLEDPLAVLTRDEKLPEAARQILADPANAAAVEALDLFLRANYLREKLKLDPQIMRGLMERYGPIDWRLPEAHSIYWAQRGINTVEDPELREINTIRNAFNSIVDFYRRGHLRFHYDPGQPERTVWQTSVHFGFMERVIQRKKEVAEEHKGADEADFLREGYLNFLREVVLDLYQHNDIKRSRKYYKELQSYGPEADVPYEDFIHKRFLERVRSATYQQNINLIQGVLFQVLYWASSGDMKQAVGKENMAKLIRKKYNDKYARRQIPPLAELYKPVFFRALRVFQDWRIERLRELYPRQVKEAEKELERLRRERSSGPPPPSPS